MGKELTGRVGKENGVKDRASRIKVETRREDLSVRKMCGRSEHTEINLVERKGNGRHVEELLEWRWKGGIML